MRVRDRGVTKLKVGEAHVDVIDGRGAEAFGILRVNLPPIAHVPEHAELGRELVVGEANRINAGVVFQEDGIGFCVELVAIPAKSRDDSDGAQ